MTTALTALSFGLGLLLYGAAGMLYFLGVARVRPGDVAQAAGPTALAPRLLGAAALAHGLYITLASFALHLCPVHSAHFLLSVASLLAASLFLLLRGRLRIEPLGVLVSPLGLAFLLGTYFLSQPGSDAQVRAKLGPAFLAGHVLSNLVGTALFLLAGGAAALYLVQERRLKKKKLLAKPTGLPPLEALDRAVHRLLVAGFPLLTLGIVSGTVFARQVEAGGVDAVLRMVLGYATWLLVALVLLLRAAAGWRGRRAAYGTIAGFLCAAAVLAVYLLRPSAVPGAP